MSYAGEVADNDSGVADGVSGERSRIFTGNRRTQTLSRVADRDRERMILLNPSKVRHGIPAKGLVRSIRQPGFISKRDSPPRTHACLTLIAVLPRRLGRCKFLLNEI